MARFTVVDLEELEIQGLLHPGITSYFVATIENHVALETIMQRVLLSHDRERLTTKLKYPGGDNEKGEDPRKVALREHKSEILRPNSKVEFNFDKAELVYVEDCDDERHRGGTHRKFFFSIWRNQLDNIGAHDQCIRVKAIPDGNDVLSSAFELPLYSIGDLMGDGAHKRAFAASVRYLAGTRRDVMDLIHPRIRDFAGID